MNIGRILKGRIIKLSATPLKNRLHMVFCNQGTSWDEDSNQIEQIDHESDFPETSEETNISALSSNEQNVLIFANDALLRQVARQIQQERLRLQKEQDAERARCRKSKN